MLGVNSAPGASTGHYCAADLTTFSAQLKLICAGEIEPVALTRLSLRLNGTRIPYAALNDVLFAHRCPAASSRYLIRVGDDAEMQVSSGLWICTQAGSTGAIASAGGSPMALGDENLQWVVISPYEGRGDALHLRKGLTGGSIKLVSRSPNNAVFLDGPTVSYRVDFGSVLEISRDATPLQVFGYGG